MCRLTFFGPSQAFFGAIRAVFEQQVELVFLVIPVVINHAICPPHGCLDFISTSRQR